MKSTLLVVLACFITYSCSLDENEADVHVVEAQTSEYERGSKKLISVLVVSPPDAGHIVKMAAIGEALARRGHNVTLCSTERGGMADLPKRLAERTGMTFLSAGPDPLSADENLEVHKGVSGKSFLSAESLRALNQFIDSGVQIARHLSKYDTTLWDVLVIDIPIAAAVVCVTKQHNWDIPYIAYVPTLEINNQPPWPFPLLGTSYSDDVTFLQRLHISIARVGMHLFLTYMISAQVNSVDNPDCDVQDFELIPSIVSTAIGLEYPRLLSPLTEYVGPVILKSSDILSSELEQWLDAKVESTVIYISMGSTASLSKEMGVAFVKGILQTGYSAVWSLRKSNRDILEGLQVEDSRFFISDWVPQQAILKSNKIAMAIVHGGMGGVSEALYLSIPLIVMPTAIDQFCIAVRVQHAGAGFYLDKNGLTAEKVQTAIETVSSPKYKKAAEKLRKIFIQAGGAERAADVVEFYGEVGYDHLVPAYIKYKWNWVQYYNVDVYATLLGSLLLVTFLMYRGLRCIWRWCTKKTKVD